MKDAVALAVLMATSGSTAIALPNIVFFLADDMGCVLTDCYLCGGKRRGS